MLLLASSVCGLFKWRQFEPEVILLAVGRYLRFSLSYRDVEELLAERGLSVDHVTVWRWAQRYAPDLERRLRKRLKATNDSWRMDETYVRAKGKWVYLYRDVFGSSSPWWTGRWRRSNICASGRVQRICYTASPPSSSPPRWSRVDSTRAVDLRWPSRYSLP